METPQEVSGSGGRKRGIGLSFFSKIHLLDGAAESF